MENLLSFFRNKWTKFTFSFVAPCYGLFLTWIAWLTFSHFLKPTNNVSLAALYLLINILFCAAMLYTRRQLITILFSLFFHPVILVIMFFEFGNWYLIVPPFIVATLIFLLSGAGETLKTVLGTIYLIFCVIGVVGYLTLQNFSINLFDVDLTLRGSDYRYSPNRTYRIVQYTDPPTKENRTIKYYVEKADEDINLPFLDCEKFYGSEFILAQRYTETPEIKWIDDGTLLLDGKVKYISKEGVNKGATSEKKSSGETKIITNKTNR